MTTAALTQHPVRALTSRLGELKEEADRRIADLESTLRHIDETKQLLNEHGLTMVVDLGPVGNAAAHARTARLADSSSGGFVAAQHRDRDAA
jgi:ABC-type enterochelin transport system substrate-binding protein